MMPRIASFTNHRSHDGGFAVVLSDEFMMFFGKSVAGRIAEEPRALAVKKRSVEMILLLYAAEPGQCSP